MFSIFCIWFTIYTVYITLLSLGLPFNLASARSWQAIQFFAIVYVACDVIRFGDECACVTLAVFRGCFFAIIRNRTSSVFGANVHVLPTEHETTHCWDFASGLWRKLCRAVGLPTSISSRSNGSPLPIPSQPTCHSAFPQKKKKLSIGLSEVAGMAWGWLHIAAITARF